MRVHNPSIADREKSPESGTSEKPAASFNSVVQNPLIENDPLERRREARQLDLKTGKISSLHLPSDADCAIFDISEGGACILLPRGAELPESFNLTIDPRRDTYLCKLAWKAGNRIGVSFQSPILEKWSSLPKVV